MDFGQLLLSILGSATVSTIILAILNRRKDKAQTRLIEEQAESEYIETADKVVELVRKQMQTMESEIVALQNKVTALHMEMDTVKTYLQFADYALTTLVTHPGIKKDYASVVDKAIKIRRGLEKWDDDTPIIFDYIKPSTL